MSHSQEACFRPFQAASLSALLSGVAGIRVALDRPYAPRPRATFVLPHQDTPS